MLRPFKCYKCFVLLFEYAGSPKELKLSILCPSCKTYNRVGVGPANPNTSASQTPKQEALPGNPGMA
jgi:phage FluMu protein Com